MKPILFNTEMVQAILEGRKTVTRRIIKPQPGPNEELLYIYAAGSKCDIGKWQSRIPGRKWNPPYHAEDILYVRETWTKLYHVDENGYTHFDQEIICYAADGYPDITLVDGDGFEEDDQRIKWKPSIHMPKEAARIFLRVKRVSVERLKQITAEQAMSEGFSDWNEFTALWNSTIKPADMDIYSWDANPWVWVIEFERCEKPKEDA